MALHAQPRATKDLDLFVQADSDNAKAVFAALTRFGAPLAGLRPEDFMDPAPFVRMGSAPQMIKIIPQISGVDFEQAWEHRTEVVVDKDSGLSVPFISAEDFIANKLAAGRPQDLADVDAVRRARMKD